MIFGKQMRNVNGAINVPKSCILVRTKSKYMMTPKQNVIVAMNADVNVRMMFDSFKEIEYNYAKKTRKM